MRPREAGVTAAGVTVAGVTEAGVTALPDHVRQRIAEADCIIAASRFHADLPDGKEILDWPTPFIQTKHSSSARLLRHLLHFDYLWLYLMLY